MSLIQNKLLFVGLFFCVLCLGAPVNALGTTISPAYSKLTISSQNPVATDTILIKNTAQASIKYKLTVADVDTQTASLLPTGTTSEITQKTFKTNVSDFVLEPNQSINIIVTATNSVDLPPGGIYATLTIQQESTANKTKQTVPINQVISVGLFLLKEDGAIRNLSYTVADQKKVRFSLPTTQKITVINNGNVELTPKGFAALTKSTNTYQKASFNELSRPVFPYKTAEYEVVLGKNGFMMPGRYTMLYSVRYDGQEDQQTYSYQFVYLPLWTVLLPLGLLIAFVLIIKYKFTKKRKGKKHIKKSETNDSKQGQTDQALVANAVPNDHSEAVIAEPPSEPAVNTTPQQEKTTIKSLKENAVSMTAPTKKPKKTKTPKPKKPKKEPKKPKKNTDKK